MEDASFLVRAQEFFSALTGDAPERLEALLPDAILAIIVVILGILVASLVHMICLRFLNFFAVDKLCAKTPLDRILKDMGIKKSVSEIIAFLLFWLTVLFTLVIASEVLHLTPLAEALSVITLYIPQVIAAFLIIIFGMLLAKFLQTLTVQAIDQIEPFCARPAGRVVQVVILVFVFLTASEQLGFNLSFLTANIAVIFSAIIVVLGIGFAMGIRTSAENIVSCEQLKRQMKVGDTVRIGDVEGAVKGFTMTTVILEKGSEEIVVPAKQFFEQIHTRSPHA